jgi:peptidoglycan/LPS O-acetylase OafA/YrhL
LSRRIPQLETLRGLAALFVLLDHLPKILPLPDGILAIPVYVPAWWTGVDLFFALSGFVVVRGLVSDACAGGRLPAVASFAVRRAFRLWPAALAVVAAVCAFAFAVDRHADASSGPLVLNEARWALAGAANLRGWLCTVHAASDCARAEILGHMWSLALEHQFYLLAPLVLIASARSAATALLLVLACVVALDRSGQGAWFFRPDALVLGSVLALVDFDRVRNRIVGIGRGRVFWTGLSAMLLAPVVVSSHSGSVGFLVVGLGAAAVVAATACAEPTTRALPRALSALGAVSYSFYLWHLPVLNAWHEILARAGALPSTQTGWMLAAAATFPFCVAAAVLSHRLVEQPCRELGGRLAERFANRIRRHAGVVALENGA